MAVNQWLAASAVGGMFVSLGLGAPVALADSPQGTRPGSEQTTQRILDTGPAVDIVRAYDAHVEATNQLDPALLEQIARRVLEEVARGDDPSAAVEACLTLLGHGRHPCTERLSRLADTVAGTPVLRLRAAVASRRTPGAADRISRVTDDFQARDWVAVVDAAPAMPAAVAVPLLARALSEATPDVQYGALLRLAAMRAPEALPVLRTWSTRTQTPGHLIALAAVARSGDKAALDAVESLFPELHGPDLLAAAEALAVQGESEGRDAVRQLLIGPDELLRLEAAAALARLGDPAGLEHLQAELGSTDVWVRLRTLEKLHGLGVPVDRRVWRQMADPMDWIRVRAAQVTLEGIERVTEQPPPHP